MEYLESVNGFRKIKLNPREDGLLLGLRGIIAGNGGSYSLGKMNQPTGEYEMIMNYLFPMIPLEKGRGVWDTHLESPHDPYNAKKVEESNSYEELPPAPELIIGSRVGIGGHSTDIDLRILMPGEDYFMSVVLGGDYKTGHQLADRDDIVRMLGERENHKLIGAQMIKHKASTNPEYGIAEVPHLRTTLKLYDRAADLLRGMPKTIGVTREELHELRKDSREHPNIAVRKLSRDEYHKTLQDLTNQ